MLTQNRRNVFKVRNPTGLTLSCMLNYILVSRMHRCNRRKTPASGCTMHTTMLTSRRKCDGCFGLMCFAFTDALPHSCLQQSLTCVASEGDSPLCLLHVQRLNRTRWTRKTSC